MEKQKVSFIFISDKPQKSNRIVKFYYQDHLLPFGHKYESSGCNHDLQRLVTEMWYEKKTNPYSA